MVERQKQMFPCYLCKGIKLAMRLGEKTCPVCQDKGVINYWTMYYHLRWCEANYGPKKKTYPKLNEGSDVSESLPQKTE